MQDVKTPDKVIEVSHVSYAYSADTVALDDVSFTVSKGDYLGLIGPNGGGKTTLIKIILGLLVPDSGTVYIGGVEFSKSKERHRIGYVSQKVIEFDSLFPATVFEVVLMGRYARRGLFRGTNVEDRRKVEEALERVSMTEFSNRRISDLSGGQKQRVFIARALAGEPDLIVLDEPTTGVDEATQEHFYALLKELNSKFQLTLILVSHDLERTTREATCIAVVDSTLTYFANPADAVVIENPEHVHHH